LSLWGATVEGATKEKPGDAAFPHEDRLDVVDDDDDDDDDDIDDDAGAGIVEDRCKRSVTKRFWLGPDHMQSDLSFD